VKRAIVLFLLSTALAASLTTAAQADYSYGGFGPGYHPYYDHWRPWWGGLGGWGPNHGYSSYPAYRCAPTSGYRYRPCLYPPSSWYYGSSNFYGGYTQYPREFIYDWSAGKGDVAPRGNRPPINPQLDPERQ
jgi:hypothetical protein